ncbi:MAG TPA: hypothetical protein VI409_11675 [Gaiellaceae bacterium]|nr:hypothetical protein [Gaiellaceae bacterium]
MDGSPVEEITVDLEGVDGSVVLTRARVVPATNAMWAGRSAPCLQARDSGVQPDGSSIERVGVSTESVTFREASGRGVVACDDSLGPREANRRWCGSAYGRLYDGRLRDPRLDIGCATQDGTPIGFVWVEPAAKARYLAVEQPKYVEVYEVVDDVPVRVATIAGVDIEKSRASFDLSEHSADGRLIRKYRLEAAVAG